MNEVLYAKINAYWDEITKRRRYIHQHPECSHQEKDTAAYIASELRKMGLEPQENVGGYGIMALIEGSGSGKCIALRADMDALDIPEQTNCPFSSENAGVMHACGHDMHMAMLLGAAKILCEMRSEFNGCVKLIFQPSEEDAADSGARAMIAAGCLEDPHVDAIFALHVWPKMPYGKIAVKSGEIMAASDRIFLNIYGKASHGSNPQDGVDAIEIASQIITALQSIVSRNCAAMDSAVITIGKIVGGTRYNVIPDKVVMEGTCRSLSREVRELLQKRLGELPQGIARSMGGECEMRYLHGYSPTYNSQEMFELMHSCAIEALGQNGVFVPEHGELTAEDFSFYGERIPSGFAWLGCGESSLLHSNTFLPDEEIMRSGIAYLVIVALHMLRE